MFLGYMPSGLSGASLVYFTTLFTEPSAVFRNAMIGEPKWQARTVPLGKKAALAKSTAESVVLIDCTDFDQAWTKLVPQKRKTTGSCEKEFVRPESLEEPTAASIPLE